MTSIPFTRASANPARVIVCADCGTSVTRRGGRAFLCQPCARERRRKRERNAWTRAEGAARKGHWSCPRCGEQKPHAEFLRRKGPCNACRANPPTISGYILDEWRGYNNRLTPAEAQAYERSPCARCRMLTVCRIRVIAQAPVMCEADAGSVTVILTKGE